MKFVGSQAAYYLKDKTFRPNTRSLSKYLLVLAFVIVLYSIVFHVIMINAEGVQHSWITGFYWTLTVMSTLGFGDITFESDIGRLFSILVLLSGIFMLLIVLPFAFIRHFYVPLIESRSRHRAPAAVPARTKDHIIICSLDEIAKDLIGRLKLEGIQYYLIEPDPVIASNMFLDGYSVIRGDLDNEETYKACLAEDAKLVLVNLEDTLNTKIILNLRHVAPKVPIVTVVTEDESVHIMQLSGANHVLPVKKWLGDQLAIRVNAQHARSHPIGQYEDLTIAEFPVHNTPLVDKTVKSSGLRKQTGVSIVGIWQRGRLHPARANMKFTDNCVLVLIGKESQFRKLDKKFEGYDINPNPVLIIGGGRVGKAAALTLAEHNIPVNLIEQDSDVCKKVNNIFNNVFVGNAAELSVLRKAGVMKAPSVLLSTNDDAMNVYLASYCRQLNNDLRIVSRITDAKNIEVIHRAGADFVLSYATLGAEAVLSISKGKDLTVLGEGVNLIIVSVPKALEDKTLLESEIGAKTGLTVIAIKYEDKVMTDLSATSQLVKGAEIVMLGTTDQRQEFANSFGNNSQ